MAVALMYNSIATVSYICYRVEQKLVSFLQVCNLCEDVERCSIYKMLSSLSGIRSVF